MQWLVGSVGGWLRTVAKSRVVAVPVHAITGVVKGAVAVPTLVTVDQTFRRRVLHVGKMQRFRPRKFLRVGHLVGPTGNGAQVEGRWTVVGQQGQGTFQGGWGEEILSDGGNDSVAVFAPC